jgi:hypothetical protein
MPIAVQCGCGNSFQAADALAGRSVNCPACGQLLAVSAPGALGGPAGFPQQPAAMPGYPGMGMPGMGQFGQGYGGFSGYPQPAAPAPAPKKAKRKSAGAEDSRARIAGAVAGGAIILVVLVAAIWIGSLVVGWFKYTNARTRINEALTLAKNGGSYDKAGYAVAADYRYLVRYCAEQSAAGSDRSRELMAALGLAIPKLPASADLETLLHLPAGSPPYNAAVVLVDERAEHDWVIAKSCDGDPHVRQFAAESLRLSFPFDTLDDAGVAELAVETSAADKQAKYEQLYDEAHRAIEAQLVGQYRLHLAGTWSTTTGTETLHEADSTAPVVEVTCANRVWTVRLHDQTWTGGVDELPSVRLSSPLLAASPGIESLPGLSADTTVHVVFARLNLGASVGPYQHFVANQRVEIGEGDDVPFGTEVTKIFDDGVLVSASYVIPGSDGYQFLQAQLVK